jgi:hypothetical protein
MDFVSTGIPAVEPRIGPDFPWKPIVRLVLDKAVEDKTFRAKIPPRKPTVRNLRRSGKPFAAVHPMTNQDCREVFGFDQANSSGSNARIEDF